MVSTSETLWFIKRKKVFYFYLAVFGNRSIDNWAVAAVDDVVVVGGGVAVVAVVIKVHALASRELATTKKQD